MQVPALLLLILLVLLPSATRAQPCPSEMNKIKDLLEVNCTGQGLSSVPLDLPTDTGILLLSANRLSSLSTASFLSLTQLQDLDLSDNGMADLQTGARLPSLKELLLSHNVLGSLPTLRGLPQLTRLSVAHNNLATLAPGAFRAVSGLQDLDLRGNRLRRLPQDVFAGLRELKDLDLSDNLLEELPRELLQDLQKLETLWLSGNLLQTLPTDFFPEGHFFAYVFLTENPWNCDCDLRYLRSWIQRNSDSVYQPERGLEKTKVEVAPEKVLCHSPPEHRHRPIIKFKPNCGNVGDTDEDEEYDYDQGEEAMEKPPVITFLSTHPTTPKEHILVHYAFTWPPLATTRPPLRSPASFTLAYSTSLANPASSRAPSTPTPAPAIPTIPHTQTSPTTPIITAAPASTPHRSTTLTSTTSLPTTIITTPPPMSSHPKTARAISTTSTHTTLMVSTGAFSTSSTAAPSTAMLEASPSVRSSSPPLISTSPMVPTSMLSTHAPTQPAPLDSPHFSQPPPSPPPAPLPLCPCSTPGLSLPLLRFQVGGKGPQWGQWVLRHCCLLHWVLYLGSLVLLVLIVMALAGWLVWMCLVGRSSWHKSLQTQEVQYPLLKRKESAEKPSVQLSSFQIPLQRPRFCTIKEVELYPEVIYCTIKDLEIQRHPPANSSFCTTKELWVHHNNPNASFQSFSKKLLVPDLSSLRAPSAYSLDRGVEAIGDVRVKYAGNTL